MKAYFFRLTGAFLFVFFTSCVTTDKGFDRSSVEDTKEFEKVVTIEKIEEPPPPLEEEKPKPKVSVKPKAVKTKAVKKSAPKKKKETIVAPVVKKEKQEQKKVKHSPVKLRQPEIEDSEGFDGRRPLVSPYRVGEEVTLAVSYFAVEAGKFTMKVLPMVKINGQKSYHFQYVIKSSPLFSMFYSVDDVAETFVDYETLLPHSYEIHVNESKQVRETRTFFDHANNKATLWDRKQKKDKKVEKTKKEWELLAYSQNVFSAGFYLRNFTLKVGKKLKVRVGHEGKNIIMTAEVIRRETIYTAAGKFDTFVVKPEFDVAGKFKPTGENYLWLTADDRKLIVRLKSKIKIGSIVGEVQKIKK